MVAWTQARVESKAMEGMAEKRMVGDTASELR